MFYAPFFSFFFYVPLFSAALTLFTFLSPCLFSTAPHTPFSEPLTLTFEFRQKLGRENGSGKSLFLPLSQLQTPLLSLCLSLSLPLHGELPASSGGALLSLGAAPVTTVLKCRGEGPYGVGRPQQATGHVCKRFNLHVHTHTHT